MGCEEMRDLIPLYSGGELEDNEKVALESHLGQCPECASETASFRESRVMLIGLRETDPPSGTYAAIWEAVRRVFFPKRVHPASWTLAYAALLLIGLSVGFLATMAAGDRPADDAPVVAEDGPRTERITNSGDAWGDYVDSRPDAPARGFSGFRLYRPQYSRPSGSFYLPRVRTIVGNGEVDF